jgi:hypothetical protein
MITNKIINKNIQDNNVNFNTMKNNDLSWEGLEINNKILLTTIPLTLYNSTRLPEPVKLLLL